MALMPVKEQTHRQAAVEVVTKALRSLPKTAWVKTAEAWDRRAIEAKQNQAYFEKQAMFTSRDYSESMVPVYETASRILKALAAEDASIKQEYPELK